MFVRRSRVFAAAVSATLTSSGTALAQVACADISGGDPIVYGAGATGTRDLVGAIAVQLENARDPLWVVYSSFGSCTGVDALTGLGPSTITGTADYWDPATGAKTTCTLPLAGETVDFATLDVRGVNCPLVNGDESLLADLVERKGPIDPVSVVVPVASTQQVISSEAFYLVYGLGQAAGIEPWTSPDPAYYQRRNEDSGTQAMVALAAGIPTNKLLGTDAGGSSTLIANLAALPDPEKAIGFATAGSADAQRASVRPLAWQAAGQDVGHWADSDASSFDKANVRRGLYEVWAAAIFYAPQGPTPGSYADPDVAVLGDYWAGISKPAGAQTIDEVAVAKKFVPSCAMHVSRDTDLGSLYAVEPAEPCDCYFDFTTTGSTSCTPCDDATPCSGSDVCRLGFCEAH